MAARRKVKTPEVGSHSACLAEGLAPSVGFDLTPTDGLGQIDLVGSLGFPAINPLEGEVALVDWHGDLHGTDRPLSLIRCENGDTSPQAARGESGWPADRRIPRP